MTLIAIRERPNGPAGSNAVLSFDGLGEFPVSVRDPFEGTGEEERLEWYFEHHLRFPFADTVKAREAAASVERYGEALFEQVFADRQAFARYSRALQAGVGSFQIEIAGSPEFHGLHWEALKDPALPRAMSLEAPLVRKNLVPQAVEAVMRPSPTINLLIVTARPHGSRDVGYRTISRPLVERLRQAKVPVRIEILRPGTYPALVQHLEEVRDRYGAGFYHVIHFDTHGGLMTHEQLQKGMESDQLLYQARYGRDDLGAYEGLKAFLLLEAEKEGQADPIEAGELADLLKTHQVPIVILNACQSGKQVGDQETSLGSRLMEAGLQVVLAMGYSVTVSAAELMMEHLYSQLFEGKDLAAAIRRARVELYNQKGRRAYFDRMIDLEDWVLPVVYQNQPVRPAVREMTGAERTAHYERQAATVAEPETAYGFVGRDLDILAVERRVLRRNLLLVRGMGGAGKTTLLHYLASWWQSTGFVGQVVAFAYDDRAWSRQQILVEIARKLLGEARFYSDFQPLSLDAQQAFLARLLRAERHLLILDNLESITGAHLAVRNTLPPAEQDALRRFLAGLAGGRTVVLLGSRGGESWLASGTFEDNVHDLPGLDSQAASMLAERILERHGAARHREDPDLARLLALLAGYPLALQVVLKNLARQVPAQVLAGLQAGDVSLDTGDSQKKTESILRCIEYSHSNLSPDAQGLLVCLAPFVGVINTSFLPQYSEGLRARLELAHLPFDRWQEVLQEAADWGLVNSHELPGYLHLQPTLPYFLRSRLQADEPSDVRQAVEIGFRELYDPFAGAMYQLLNSKEPQERKLGQALIGVEYENLRRALDLALEAKASILEPYRALSGFLDHMHDEERGLELGEQVLARLKTEEEKLPPQLGFELAGVIDDVAKRKLLLKRYDEAQESYRKALDLVGKIKDLPNDRRAKLTASVHHQLGYVAQEQRQWLEAESYYKQALQIFIDFNDRHSQASTYHQLGNVAQEQRQWSEAESYYKQALQIYIDFNDRYEQADTYHQLGNVAEAQRQWSEAETYYKQSLQIDIDFGNHHPQASTYHQLGNVAEAQRQWLEAESYYKQALQIKIAFNDRHSQALTYHQLGIVAQAQRQLSEAESYYKQALQVFIDFNDRYGQAGTYHQLGIVAQAQRQLSEAESYYKQALQIYIDFNDRYKEAGTYHQLGVVAEERQQWEQARAHLLEALSIYRDYQEGHKGGIVLRSLARVWKASGDPELPKAMAGVFGVAPEEVEELLRSLEA